MTKGPDAVARVSCEVSFPLYRAVFTGDRLRRVDRPFHMAILIAIVEFGGYISLDEASTHLLPGVPASIYRSVARKLAGQGLLEDDGRYLYLTEEGLSALRYGSIPVAEHGTWVVDWIQIDSNLQIVSVTGHLPRITDLLRAKRQLDLDECPDAVKDLAQVTIPDEVFAKWNSTIIDGHKWYLVKSLEQAEAMETGSRLKLRLTSAFGEISLKAEYEGDEYRVPPESRLAEWAHSFVQRVPVERVQVPSVDELSDIEVLDFVYTRTLSRFPINESVECLKFQESGIPIEPLQGEIFLWMCRLMALSVSRVPSMREWETNLDVARLQHPRLLGAPNVSMEEVINDLERRGLVYTESWWNLSMSIDWMIAG